MKKLILLSIIVGTFIFTGGVEAKLLPRFTNTSKSVGQRIVSSGLIVSPKLRFDRQALILTLSNLNKVKSVTYTLMYQTNGVDQGAQGTLDSSSGQSVLRELLFGTCSDVCRYHSNITNMKLEIITELPSGKQTMRRYRIKV